MKTQTQQPQIHECAKCRRIVSKKELDHNAKFGGYGFERICDRCAEKIDHEQDAQQQDRV